jgi:murein L,D-transpeptidase YcbB/YkuD
LRTKLHISLTLLLVIILMASCSDSNNSKENKENKTLLTPKEKCIETFLEEKTEELTTQLNVETTDSLFQVAYSYSQPVKLIWISDSITFKNGGDTLIHYLLNSEQFGLPSPRYNAKRIAELFIEMDSLPSSSLLVELDILLTRGYVKLAKDLHNGLIRDRSYYTKLEIKQDTLNTIAFILDSTKSWMDKLADVQPHHKEYHLLQKSLAKFVATNELSEDIIVIPNFRKDSVAAYDKAKEVLIRLNYCQESTVDSNLVLSVKKFQADNGLIPDGLIGKYTAKMLEYSTMDIYIQAAVNLEKWRWIENWGDQYIFANIPEYMIKIYKGNELVRENRTVVGTLTNYTPEIDSKLERFIVNPEWFVPYSITSKELIPKMKKDPTYLSRNGYAMTNGSDISSIDWANANPSTFSHKIKQTSGGYNALGKVKFIFKNSHSVYFHDTPSKSFFERDIRSYSHGCVRVQDPFEIARYIVNEEDNEFWKTNFDSIIQTSAKKTFTPKKEYPIHIAYFTSTGDSLGNLRTFVDIYNQHDSLKGSYRKLWNENYTEIPKIDTLLISQIDLRN